MSPRLISSLIAEEQPSPSRVITLLLKALLTPTEKTNSPPLLHRVGPTNLDQ